MNPSGRIYVRALRTKRAAIVRLFTAAARLVCILLLIALLLYQKYKRQPLGVDDIWRMALTSGQLLIICVSYINLKVSNLLYIFRLQVYYRI